MMSVNSSKPRFCIGERIKLAASPTNIGDCRFRKAAEDSFNEYSPFTLFKKPITVNESHKIRTPRDEALQASAIFEAVLFPSAIRVNMSSSIADFIAAER